NFDMNSIEKGHYQNTKNNGRLALKGFEYTSEEFKNPVAIDNASMTFSAGDVTLNSFMAKTGQTDLSATGTIANLLGYMFNKETLKGNFDLNSNTFAINDFMMVSNDEESASESNTQTKNTPKTEQPSGQSGEQEIKVPSVLDASINAKANRVIYDGLTLNEVAGTLVVRDEAVSLKRATPAMHVGYLALH